jgi:hypothetical protein
MMQTHVRWTVAVALAAACAAPAARAQAPAQPGPEHAELKKMEGTWDATMNMGGMESKAVATYKMDLGGLWLLSTFEGSIGGQKFSGRGADTFDAKSKKHVGLWIDSMSTVPMVMEGSHDKATRTTTMVGDVVGPDGKPVKHKTVTKLVDDNTMHFAMYPVDAKEPAFTIVYKRRK